MDFGTNKTPTEVIKEGALSGTYFRDIYSGVNDKWYRNSWDEFQELDGIYNHYYSSNYYNVKINKY